MLSCGMAKNFDIEDAVDCFRKILLILRDLENKSRILNDELRMQKTEIQQIKDYLMRRAARERGIPTDIDLSGIFEADPPRQR